MRKTLHLVEPALVAATSEPDANVITSYTHARNALHSAPTYHNTNTSLLLDRLNAIPNVVTSHVEHVYALAVVRARAADGTEALLLSIDSGDDVAAGCPPNDARAATLILALAHLMARAPWLTSDVVIHIPIGDHGAQGSCEGPAAAARLLHGSSSLRSLLRSYVAAELPVTVGLIRQAIVVEHRGSALAGLCVGTYGRNGRQPNLDLYATVHAAAKSPSIRIPLRIFPASAAAGDGRDNGWASSALHALAYGAATLTGTGSRRHAEALALGIDSISLTSGAPCTVDRAAQGYDGGDVRLLGMLELTLRSLSNLDESLHHSYYFFVPTSVGVFFPLSVVVPLIVLPSLALLLLRAAHHHRAGTALEGLPAQSQLWRPS